MVLLQGSLDDCTIGEHVPAAIFATQIADTALASPLVGALDGTLTEVLLGRGLAIAGNILYVDFSAGPTPSPPPPPPSPPPSPSPPSASLYGSSLYGAGLFGTSGS